LAYFSGNLATGSDPNPIIMLNSSLLLSPGRYHVSIEAIMNNTNSGPSWGVNLVSGAAILNPYTIKDYTGFYLGSFLGPSGQWKSGANISSTFLNVPFNIFGSVPLTTHPMTTKPLTTQPLTTRELSTQSLTTKDITTQPLTTNPLTTQPLTTQELTTQPLSTQKLTTQPLSTQPLTTRKLTTNPVTSNRLSQPISTQPLTTKALTTQEFTTSQLSRGYLTTKPITTQTVTTAFTIAALCATYPNFGAQGYFCSDDHMGFYQCLSGAFATQSQYRPCAAGTQCRCAPGVECSAFGVCTF